MGKAQRSTPDDPSTVLEQRLAAIEARVEMLESRQKLILGEQKLLRAELAQRGVLAVVIDPQRKAPKISAEGRRAIQRQTAAAARAAKQVGAGMGAVKSKATKKRLELEAAGRGARRGKP
jgi:hypothetical protein